MFSEEQKHPHCSYKNIEIQNKGCPIKELHHGQLVLRPGEHKISGHIHETPIQWGFHGPIGWLGIATCPLVESKSIAAHCMGLLASMNRGQNPCPIRVAFDWRPCPLFRVDIKPSGLGVGFLGLVRVVWWFNWRPRGIQPFWAGPLKNTHPCRCFQLFLYQWNPSI